MSGTRRGVPKEHDCMIRGCVARARIKGLCSNHYARFRNSISPKRRAVPSPVHLSIPPCKIFHAHHRWKVDNSNNRYEQTCLNCGIMIKVFPVAL